MLIGVIRQRVKSNARYQQWSREKRQGRVFDFAFDAVLVPSPYASSFGGFVELTAVYWWTAGGLISAAFDFLSKKLKPAQADANGAVPEDMSTMSLVGGGLIAGDSLAALSVGVYGLLKTVL